MAGEVILLLGSNKGRRVQKLREGLAAVSRAVDVAAVSRIHASEPWGRANQPWFLNVAVRGTSRLSPEELLRFAKEAEASAGRRAGARWGPRELDIDILLMGDTVVRRPHLEIPHPGLARRRFCLAPTAEIAPGAVVPPGGATVRELLAACRDPLEVFAI